MLTVEKLKTFDNPDLKSQWNNLWADYAYGHVFLSYEWLSTWWKIYGKNRELAIVVVRDEDEIIGLAPLMISVFHIPLVGTVKMVEFVGTGYTDYHDFIVKRKAPQVIQKIIEYLKHEKIRVIRLRHLSEHSPNLPIIRELLATNGFGYKVIDREVVECPYLEIEDDFDTYFKTRSKNLRKSIRKKERRLKKLGELKLFRVHGNDAQIETHLKRVFDLHRKNWESRDEWCFFSYAKAENREFVEDVIKQLGQKDWCSLFLLTLNGEMIAYIMSFTYNNVVFLWNTSYALEYDQFGPGKLIHHKLIEYLYQNGFARCDFLRGKESYKMNFCNTTSRNYEISLFGKGRITKMMQWYYISLKPFLESNRFFNKLMGIRFINKMLGK